MDLRTCTANYNRHLDFCLDLDAATIQFENWGRISSYPPASRGAKPKNQTEIGSSVLLLCYLFPSRLMGMVMALLMIDGSRHE